MGAPVLINGTRYKHVMAITRSANPVSRIFDRTEVNDPEQKLIEAATHHLTTPDERRHVIWQNCRLIQIHLRWMPAQCG